MHNIHDVPSLVEGLPGDEVDNETTKPRGPKPHEWRFQNDVSRKSHLDNKGPEKMGVICSTKDQKSS